MSYPSLLYCAKQEMKKIPISVFEDLQLTCFISTDTVSKIRFSCNKENRVARRELFSNLLEKNNQDIVRNLNSVAKELIEIDGEIKKSSCDVEKKLLFVSLMKKDAEFTSLASGFDYGDMLSKNFAEYFKNREKSEIYKNMTSDLPSAISGAEKICGVSIKTDTEKCFLNAETKKTYFDILSECANDLGISVNTEFDAEKNRLSPDILISSSINNSDEMKSVSEFYKKYSGVYSDEILYYFVETDFYISFCNLIQNAKEVGVSFCNPIERDIRILEAHNAYDISLTAKKERVIVPNDVRFDDVEPFFYLTGANGGGKTTYLRAVGILTLMYLLGCPVPSESAEIGGIDSLYTHFPRDERFDGSGRFVEENTRVQKITSVITKASLVLFNETYSSTNEENAVKMTESLANEMYDGGYYGLYITHQHGVNDDKIPYLQVVIDKDDMNKRTFKVSKSKSTGGSFAKDILTRYGLTSEALEKRFGSFLGEESK